MLAVVVSAYYNSIINSNHNIFLDDKIIVVDSKVLMLDVYDELEAYYVCGIINAPSVINVIDGYAVSTNRGVNVLKYGAISKFNKKINCKKKCIKYLELRSNGDSLLFLEKIAISIIKRILKLQI